MQARTPFLALLGVLASEGGSVGGSSLDDETGSVVEDGSAHASESAEVWSRSVGSALCPGARPNSASSPAPPAASEAELACAPHFSAL